MKVDCTHLRRHVGEKCGINDLDFPVHFRRVTRSEGGVPTYRATRTLM
jgi:hypothetical protein